MKVCIGTEKIPLDWLFAWVAMVKTVIKAIKAAGAGLNGSTDYSRCHILSSKGQKEHVRVAKVWKNEIGKRAARQKKKKENMPENTKTQVWVR